MLRMRGVHVRGVRHNYVGDAYAAHEIHAAACECEYESVISLARVYYLKVVYRSMAEKGYV